MTTRIGIISDTHMPERWKQLPEKIFEVFGDVDIILHAGDVGELWVLDRLATVAPVIAVHGNDETAEAEAALPYLQTIATSGHRIVLTHAHYPDRAEELANRTNDWNPHFRRRIDFAQQHDADIIIYGHFHIPMVMQREGIWLVNPGAIASGNPWMQQIIQTVAVMTLDIGQPPQVTHFHAITGEIHTPIFDKTGFMPTHQHYNEIILEADLYAEREWLWNVLMPLAPEMVKSAILSVCHTRWNTDNNTLISAREVVDTTKTADLPKTVLDALSDHTLFAQYI